MLSVSEANDLNLFIQWLLEGDRYRDGFPPPTDDEARAALQSLADKAHKRLSSGFDGKAIERLWRRRKPLMPPTHESAMKQVRDAGEAIAAVKKAWARKGARKGRAR